MRITKLEHAALTIDEGGHVLVVDPGSLTTPMVDVTGVEAVVITHEHADHWTPEQLRRILGKSPKARLFGPAGVVAAATDFTVEQVEAGDTVSTGTFTLRFFGGEHALIHSSIPVVDNLGVLVNGRFYYPGDSFTIPEGVDVDTLAAPAAAPWMKISEVMDYVSTLRPRRAFPTHDGILSTAGMGLSNQRIGEVVRAGGGEYYPLIGGESLDV